MPNKATLQFPSDAKVLMASDMHLGSHDPATAFYFRQSLKRQMQNASHLILLGDLFEAWPGDDQSDPLATQFIELLATIGQLRPVFLMRGNRDFLLNVTAPSLKTARFSDQIGGALLDEPCTISVADVSAVLLHGDVLCTDDHAYQRFREQCRQDPWQQHVLAQPLAERIKLAGSLRAESEQAKSDKTHELMDANQAAIDALLNERGQHVMIHGHTHRPDTHQWQFDGQSRTRYVLSDWHADQDRGDFLLLSADGVTRIQAGLFGAD